MSDIEIERPKCPLCPDAQIRIGEYGRTGGIRRFWMKCHGVAQGFQVEDMPIVELAEFRKEVNSQVEKGLMHFNWFPRVRCPKCENPLRWDVNRRYEKLAVNYLTKCKSCYVKFSQCFYDYELEKINIIEELNKGISSIYPSGSKQKSATIGLMYFSPLVFGE